MLLLSGCGSTSDGGEAPANQAVAIPEDTAAEPRIDCATSGNDFAPACTVASEAADGATILTIRHPDGGFRRLRVSATGEVVAADGAVPAAISTDETGATEVAIDGDRYRLPPGIVPSPAR